MSSPVLGPFIKIKTLPFQAFSTPSWIQQDTGQIGRPTEWVNSRFCICVLTASPLSFPRLGNFFVFFSPLGARARSLYLSLSPTYVLIPIWAFGSYVLIPTLSLSHPNLGIFGTFSLFEALKLKAPLVPSESCMYKALVDIMLSLPCFCESPQIRWAPCNPGVYC